MDRQKAKNIQKERAMPEERLLRRGQVWLCEACEFVLGYVSPDKREVRMKAKDFFLTVEGGKITHPCRRCGKVNTIAEEEFLIWKSEQNSFKEFIANRKLFEEYLKSRAEFKKFLAGKKKEDTKKMGGK